MAYEWVRGNYSWRADVHIAKYFRITAKIPGQSDIESKSGVGSAGYSAGIGGFIMWNPSPNFSIGGGLQYDHMELKAIHNKSDLAGDSISACSVFHGGGRKIRTSVKLCGIIPILNTGPLFEEKQGYKEQKISGPNTALTLEWHL